MRPLPASASSLRPSRIGLLLVVAWLTGCFAIIEQPEGKPYQGTRGWIIQGTRAKSLHQKGALFVDVRDRASYDKQHIQGAVHTTWQTFSEPKAPHQGRLLADDALLTQRLQALGVKTKTPVVVYGNPAKGWGEEGRIAWMLRVLGHTQVTMVDGGYLALVQSGLPTTATPTSPTPGDFVVRRNAAWAIDKSALQKLVVQQKAVPSQVTLIDTRELREYNGQTPYGESRGGHIPGAVHLHFRSLVNRMGFLLPRDQLLQTLQAKGIVPHKPTVVYCTGGIRSGWFAVVLVDLGFPSVKNYAGSLWEWSAGPASQYPLTTANP